MNLQEYYLNSGIQQTKIVEYCVASVKTLENAKIKTTDSELKKRIELKEDEIVKDLHIAFDKALLDFTNALKFKNPNKQVYLHRAYLNSSNTIWDNSYDVLSKLELSNKISNNYLFAASDYENYFELSPKTGKILETNCFEEPEIALKLLKCRYLARDNSLAYIHNKRYFDNSVLSYYDSKWKIWEKYHEINRKLLGVTSIADELNKLIENKPIKEAIYFRVEIASGEIENLVLKNRFILREYEWIQTNGSYELKRELKVSTNKKITNAPFIIQAVKDIDFLLENGSNESWLYYNRGFFHYILGDFEKANKDFDKYSLSNNPYKLNYYRMTIDSIIRQREFEEYREFEEHMRTMSNECACGENPCRCSDRDN